MASLQQAYVDASRAILERTRREMPKRQADKIEIRNAEICSRADGSVVYFIKEHGYVKIGKAKSLKRRLSELQMNHPATLEVLGYIPGYTTVERQLHSTFRNLRVRGEWFLLKQEILTFIEENCR